MKKIVLAAILLGFTLPAVAQQAAQPAQDEVVVVKKSDLTAEQLAKVKLQEVSNQLGAYKEYAEMGRGVGLAVGESLRGVKDVVLDFSKTDVGKYTMFLIAWKIMAKDIINMGNQVFGYLVGVPTLFIGALILVWSYRRQCVPRRVLIKKTKDESQWAIFTPNGKLVNLGDEESVTNIEARAIWALGHVAVGVVFFLFCSVMIFGCGK